MSKSSSSSRSSKSSSRAMSNNSSRRAKPMIPKAGFTMHRSRYGKGGSLYSNLKTHKDVFQGCKAGDSYLCIG